MSIADRAIQAYEASEQVKAAEKEAKRARERAEVIETIGRRAEVFGIDFDADKLHGSDGGYWTYKIPVDDDAELVFNVRPMSGLHVSVSPCDQLYWDLPPGQERKEPGEGGTYACYSLSKDREIATLADLGRELQRVRLARDQWKSRHGVERENPSG